MRFGKYLSSILLALVCLLTISPTSAQPEVFVNNKPFKGDVLGSSNLLYLDAEVLATMVKFELDVDLESGTVSLGEESLDVKQQDSKLYVNGKQLADKFGGRYLVNSELQSVDLYLIDERKPAASAGPGPNTVISVKRAGTDSYYPETYTFNEENSEIKLSYKYQKAINGISIRVNGPDGERWSFDFAAPKGEKLKPGVYEGTRGWSGKGPKQPELSLSANSRSHSSSEGKFTVHEIIYGAKSPASFSADFVLYKARTTRPSFRGKIRFRSWGT